MINTNHLCMACMKNKGESDVCPYCKFQDDGSQRTPYLPTKTWLMDRYLVGKTVNFDGEGITYIGWDNILQTTVLIREFLPSGLCSRDNGAQVTPLIAEDYNRCLTAFLDLHRALGRMRDLVALFPVYDIFECNGTAYTVSEYIESISLDEFLRRNGGTLTFDQTRTLLMPVVSTLSSLNSAGIVHGGISPETLYVGKDGKLRLTGFAGSELRFARGALKTQLFNGFAALEQYGFNGKEGPHTDVYAFAATLYRVISGVAPTSAKERVNNDTFTISPFLSEKMPSHAVDALHKALQLMPEQRTPNMERFRSEFSATPVLQEEPKTVTKPAAPAKEPVLVESKKSHTGLYIFLAMLLTLAILVGGCGFLEYKLDIFGLFPKEELSSTPSLTVSSEPEVSSAPAVSNGLPSDKLPNFVGQDYKKVKAQYNNSYYFKEYKVYDDKVAKDVIVAQSPEGNSEIMQNSGEAPTITIWISMGPDKRKVPNIINMTYAEAMDKLWDAGFFRESIMVANVANPAWNYIVTRVTPNEGTPLSVYDAQITLYLDPPTTEVPSIEENNGETPPVPEQEQEVTEQ